MDRPVHSHAGSTGNRVRPELEPDDVDEETVAQLGGEASLRDLIQGLQTRLLAIEEALQRIENQQRWPQNPPIVQPAGKPYGAPWSQPSYPTYSSDHTTPDWDVFKTGLTTSTPKRRWLKGRARA